MEPLKWLQLGKMLPVHSFINFCRTCGSKVVLNSGSFTQKLFVMVGFPRMDSHITVEPLIKDALRQGH